MGFPHWIPFLVMCVAQMLGVWLVQLGYRPTLLRPLFPVDAVLPKPWIVARGLSCQLLAGCMDSFQIA